jgi:hypothetical protein
MAVSAGLITLRLVFITGLHSSASLALDMGMSLITTLVVAALTKPAPMDVLVAFYAKVRPFGIWGPVRREAVKRGLVPAKDMMPRMDALNGLITAAFQFTLALLPFYALLRNWHQFGIWIGVAAGLCFILYFTWYKNLPAKDEI